MTTLMIVEPEATGHRMILYVRLIVAEALARGWQVILLTSAEAIRHPACAAVMAEFGRDLKVRLMPAVVHSGSSQLDLLRAQYTWIRSLRATYRVISQREHADFVYLPYFNYIDKVVGWYGSPFDDVLFGGMMLAATFHHARCGVAGIRQKSDKMKEWLFRSALRVSNLALVTSIDEPLFDYVNQVMPRYAGKLRYVPDVSSIRQPAERNIARAAYGFSEKDFVVVSYGSLSPRKGLAKLLSLFGARDLPAHFRLLLVGAQDAERMTQLVSVDRFVTDLEEGQAFACADLIWVCYENFSGMSGVLIQAAQAGVPVVTADYGLIDRNREKYTLGIRWNDFAVREGAEVRFDWLRLSESVAAISGSPSLREFAAAHAPHAFGRNVIDAIVSARVARAASVRAFTS
jgi:glycosyltransferase involved in cell wall biosynthesis